MLIRPATPADVVSIRELERQSATAAHWAEREYGALFAPDAPKRITLVAAEENEITGFVISRCGFEEWEIENVVVAQGHRRTGIARSLVRELLRLAQEAAVTSVLLEVRESNVPARGLYQHLGFVEVGRRPRYYQDPVEDALLLKSPVSFL